MTRSLRSRLIVGMFLGMAVLLIAAGTTIYTVQRQQLYRAFDDSLLSSANSLATADSPGALRILVLIPRVWRGSRRARFAKGRCFSFGATSRSTSLRSGQAPIPGRANRTPHVPHKTIALRGSRVLPDRSHRPARVLSARRRSCQSTGPGARAESSSCAPPR